MANHCYNEITIEAPPRIVQMFAEAVEDRTNLIEIFAPNTDLHLGTYLEAYSHMIRTESVINISADSNHIALSAFERACRVYPEIRKIEVRYSELHDQLLGYYHSDFGNTRFDAPSTRAALDAFNEAHPIMAEFAEAEIGFILEAEEEDEQ